MRYKSLLLGWNAYMQKETPMNDDKPTSLSFVEDSFDLYEYKKTANAKARKKARIKRIHRKIKYGKAVLALLALVVSVALYYVISVVFNIF